MIMKTFKHRDGSNTVTIRDDYKHTVKLVFSQRDLGEFRSVLRTLHETGISDEHWLWPKDPACISIFNLFKGENDHDDQDD